MGWSRGGSKPGWTASSTRLRCRRCSKNTERHRKGAAQEPHPKREVFSPSPLVGEGLGRGGHAETLALVPLSPSPSPARGEGSKALAPCRLVPGRESVALTAPHGSLPYPSPAGGEGLRRPVCGGWLAPVGGVWARGLGARVWGGLGGRETGCRRSILAPVSRRRSRPQRHLRLFWWVKLYGCTIKSRALSSKRPPSRSSRTPSGPLRSARRSLISSLRTLMSAT
jgi:hypothetical protein